MKYTFCISLISILSFLTPSLLVSQTWNWAESISSGNSEESFDVAVDKSSGHVYIVGKWKSDLSAEFPSSGNEGTDFTSTYGDYDGFVAKFDAYGSVIWAFHIGGPGKDVVNALTLDAEKNIYITGTINEGINHFTGVSSQTDDSTIINTDNLNAFVAKYTSDGDLVWVKDGNGGNNAEGLAITCTTTEVYVAGKFENSIAFDSLSRNLSFGNSESFVAKLNTWGIPDWIIGCGSNSEDFTNDVIADQNYVYFVGQYQGNIFRLYDKHNTQIDSLENDDIDTYNAYLGSITSDGLVNWVHQISGMGDESAIAIELLKDSLFITGGVSNESNFPEYPSNPVSISAGTDIFISAHDKTTGNTGWLKIIDCSFSGKEYGADIIRINEQQLAITGSYQGILDFFGKQLLTADNGTDIFAALFTTGGDFISAVSAPGQGQDISAGIASDAKNKLYITGTYDNDIDFGGIALAPSGNNDIFLSQILLPIVYAGTISVSEDTLCQGDSVHVTLTDYLGYIGWEYSLDGQNTWVSYPDEFNDTLMTIPSDDLDIRAKLQIEDVFDYSDTIHVKIHSLPTATIAGDTAICLGESAPLFFNCSGNAPWSLEYSDGFTNYQLEEITHPDYSIDITPDSTLTYTILSLTDAFGCKGSSGGNAHFLVNDLPNIDPGQNENICGLEIDLQGTLSGGTGSWWQVSGPGKSIFAPDTLTPNAHLQVDKFGEYEYQWTVSNGVCMADSVIKISFFKKPESNAGPDKDICGSATSLEAIPDIGVGEWRLLSGPGITSFTINQSDTKFEIPEYDYGIYKLEWSETNGTCWDGDTTQIQFIQNPVVDLGEDQSMCGLETSLSSPTAVGEGSWIYVSGPASVNLSDSQSPSTHLYADVFGTYTIRRVEQNQMCEDFDDVTISFYEVPVAYAGPDQELEYFFEADMNAQIDPLETGTWTLLDGSGSISDIESPTSLITELSTGENRFQWKVSNPGCSSADEMIIKVNDLVLPSIITPNGDSKNDFFIVTGIENYSPASLTIIDRWGNELYNNGNYNNEWNGIRNNGQELSNDTYFYLLRLSNNDTFNGFIMINR